MNEVHVLRGRRLSHEDENQLGKHLTVIVFIRSLVIQSFLGVSPVSLDIIIISWWSQEDTAWSGYQVIEQETNPYFLKEP